MKKRIIVTMLIFFLFIIPLLTSPFPPTTDLPQHLSQIRLLMETLKEDSGHYKIQWAAPNTFVYTFIYLFWQILPPELVGKAILILLILFWLIAIHFLSYKKDIPIESAILASLFVFNLSFYWGFLNFLIGFPVFVIWFVLTSKVEHEYSLKGIALLMSLSFLLFLSHALWFAVGAIWLVLINLVNKTPWKPFFLRLAALIPTVVLAMVWFVSFTPSRTEAGFQTAPQWPSLTFRLSFPGFVNSVFGGIRGPTEFLVFCLVCTWTALLIWKYRKRLNFLFDKISLTAGFFFLAIFFVAPSTFMNTAYFSSRWAPIAMIFLILSLRLPLSEKPVVSAMPFFIAIGFVLMTSIAWHKFNSKELSGLEKSLDRITPASTVLGLDLIRNSEYIKGEPFFQIFSYSQAQKGCELSFSFAEHGTGIVAYRASRKRTWSKSLEWYPERTKKSDLRFFDYVLVNAGEISERFFLETSELIRMTSSGLWQLYKVQPVKVGFVTEFFKDDYLFFPPNKNERKK
jgi:hypothetical protein